MVAKISHGASLYGALHYNHEKIEKGTAEILSGSRMISDRPRRPGEDMRLALLSFENYLLANRNTEKPVLHIALSPAPEDKLTDEQLVEAGVDPSMIRFSVGIENVDDIIEDIRQALE